MKRVLLALALCAPLTVFAEGSAKNDPFTQGDAAAGNTKSAACGACHGPTGNSAMAEWPKLAGQSSRFLFDQLKAYKAGTRQNPVMQGQVAALSEQDMRDLAAHYALQKPAAGVGSKDALAIAQPLYRAGNAARALPACGACHGPNGAGNAAAGYPRIGGQHATYAAARLRAYRELGSQELPDGNQKMMAAVAAKLSDKEIDALASYLNGLQ